MMKDPVCGMLVDEQKTAIKSLYKGQACYFCSESCKQKFEKKPEMYLKQPGGAR